MVDITSSPFYRLHSLILDKYGKKNYYSGCDLVARWITEQSKRYTTPVEVRMMCEITEADLISEHKGVALALKSLFHLQSLVELFTLPETAPEDYFPKKLKAGTMQVALAKKHADIIIATNVAGFDRWVLRAVLNPNRVRIPKLTDDPEKAQRFYTNHEANQIIARFPKDGNRYISEPFVPAANKNLCK
jgi:hypothetical protein